MEMRALYQKVLRDLMTHNPKVVMLDADLASASGSSSTFKDFPNQSVNVGIAEANMISSACGMSLTGLIPFVHTFAPFATRRVFDQVFMSGAYSNNAIHIYGSDPGYFAQHNGGTHTSYEDLALMRTLPGVVVTAPCDQFQFEFVLRSFANDDRLYYTRATRKELPQIYDENYRFELGKWNILSEGMDCVVFAMGAMVKEALEAQKSLEEEDIHIMVVDAFSIKPYDKKLLSKLSQTHQKFVSVENHSIYGGLGDLVASELMSYGGMHHLIKIAVNDQFGEVGTADYLQAKHQLNANRIVEAVKRLVQ